MVLVVLNLILAGLAVVFIFGFKASKLHKEATKPVKEEKSENTTDVCWPEFITCLQEQYGFDLQALVENCPDVLLDEVGDNVEAQYGVNLGYLFDNIKVDVVAIAPDGTLVDCTIGG